MIEEIHQKLSVLVEKAHTLKEAKEKLQATIVELETQRKADREIIQIQKNIIAELENQLNKANLASRIEEKDSEEKAKLKREITEYIKEIDEIVDFLKVSE